jgi:hypothetical protein
LRLTRIDTEGRHTRQRITREEAVLVAGNGKDAVGEHVVQLLSGDGETNRWVNVSWREAAAYAEWLGSTEIRNTGKQRPQPVSSLALPRHRRALVGSARTVFLKQPANPAVPTLFA